MLEHALQLSANPKPTLQGCRKHNFPSFPFGLGVCGSLQEPVFASAGGIPFDDATGFTSAQACGLARCT